MRGRALVNAAGPWVRDVVGEIGVAAQPANLRLVKGSHIVVPRIAGANDAYLCQSADGRVVFAIPYEERFTLIGTTEIAYSGDPARSRPSTARKKTICWRWRGSSSPARRRARTSCGATPACVRSTTTTPAAMRRQ